MLNSEIIIDATLDQRIDVPGILLAFATDLTHLKSQLLERNMPEIAEFIGTFIIQKITELHPIGQFMGPRTEVTVEGDGSPIIINIGGKPETDVTDQYTERRKYNDVPYNLWAMFEYGRETGVSEGFVRFAKISGAGVGTTVSGMRRTHTPLAEFEGKVESIIEMITPLIEETLTNLIGELIDDYAISSLFRASNGGVRIQKDPNLNLSSTGASDMRGLNIKQQLEQQGFMIYVNEGSNQVSLRNIGTGKFVSPKNVTLGSATDTVTFKTQ